MVIVLEITNIWQKSRILLVPGFFLRFLKSIGWYGFSVVLNVFKVINNIKFYKRYFIKDDLQKHYCIIGWCLVSIG
jgi:hypothetical protein